MDGNDIVEVFLKVLSTEEKVTEEELKVFKDYIRSGLLFQLNEKEISLLDNLTTENIKEVFLEVMLDNIKYQISLRYGS